MDDAEPSALAWRIADDASAVDLAVISEGVLQHGRAIAARVGGDARPLACLVTEGETLVAGATGRTEFGRLFVSYLWVAPPLRGRGLGTEILARVEEEASQRGCTDALIETLNDRNALLYQRLGYRTIAVVDYLGPFRRHTLLKPLRPDAWTPEPAGSNHAK